MGDDVTSLFLRHDNAMNGECPTGFDYATARKRAAAFAAELGRRLGQESVGALDVRIEDASFHSEISFAQAYGYLRFSSFGDMIALTPDHDLPRELVAAIQSLAESHGYTFVPTDQLETPYTGRHPGVAGIATWWIRYFDYL
jgi:hypothetical protein